MHDEYESGIGGGLMFLILYLLTLQPLAVFVGLLTAQFLTEEATPGLAGNPDWLAFKSASWWLYGGCAFVGVAAAFFLWKHHRPISRKFAVFAACILPPAAQIASYVLFAQRYQGIFDGDAYLSRTIAVLVSSLVWSGIWCAYLLRARRVRELYV
ncbi:DUF2569 family protein [Burkholderia gladioli]|uniref:DUF2569 family protein n=1 Tax=Burkholderia gladioli TaxID=28095 RepID=UPI00163FEE31|nr:DUF2569 family protein [Burkholderia gladioli]